MVDTTRTVRYGPPMTKTKKCKSCREPFAPKQWFQKFCSNKCRSRDVRKRKREAKERVNG